MAMRRIARRIMLLGLVAGTVSATDSSAQNVDRQRFITLGTAGVTGVYYPTGGAICRLVNKTRRDHGVRCSVESTDGSAFNIGAIDDGELTMGVVQSDVQMAALAGQGAFVDRGPVVGLRSVLSIHSEPLHLLVRDGGGIESFDDLKGKIVNVGNSGSGQAQTVRRILDYLGWKETDFGEATRFKSNEQSRELCANRIDAMFFTAGIPSGSIKEATTTCISRLVPMNGEWVDGFIAENPAFARAVIPGGIYRNNEQDVATFGPKATLVTLDTVPEDVVYTVVSSVFDQFDQFRQLHPAFADLQMDDMISDGLAAPLHPGAERYYRERGYLP